MKELKGALTFTSRNTTGAGGIPWAPVLFCAISLAANVLLAVQTLKLSRTMHVIREENQLAEGKYVFEMSVVDPQGRNVALSFVQSRPTILYAVAEQCGWCKARRSWIESLHASADSQLDFVGVCLDGAPPDGCSAARPRNAAFFYSPKGLGGEMLKLGNAPQNAVISATGQVVLYLAGEGAGRLGTYIAGLPDESRAEAAKDE